MDDLINIIKNTPLLEDIINNDAVPCIGAGFSKNVDDDCRKYILDWNDLAREISGENNREINPPEVISEYVKKNNKGQLFRKIQNIWKSHLIKPGKVHNCFSDLPFKSILTTNFDNLIEDYYSEKKSNLKKIIKNLAP